MLDKPETNRSIFGTDGELSATNPEKPNNSNEQKKDNNLSKQESLKKNKKG